MESHEEIILNHKSAFVVNELSSLVRAAKPHLEKCVFMLGEDVPLNQTDILSGKNPYITGDEYVLVLHKNGRYEINVSGDSLIAIAGDVISQIAGK